MSKDKKKKRNKIRKIEDMPEGWLGLERTDGGYAIAYPTDKKKDKEKSDERN